MTSTQDALVARIRATTARDGEPLIVALDGRSGAGKSTLARQVADRIAASVIDGDDFYAGGSAESWDAMSAEEKAAIVIDWRRQRPVLETLRRGEPASYHPYDWADEGNDGLATRVVTVTPASVVLLDGAYSARPELADLLDLRVLLRADDELRHARLRARDGSHWDWEMRWAEAEAHYFGVVMPPERFDLVLP